MANNSLSSRMIGWLGGLLAIVLIAAAAVMYFSPQEPVGEEGLADYATVAVTAQAAANQVRRAMSGDAASIEALARSRTGIVAARRAINADNAASARFGALLGNDSGLDPLIDAIETFVESEQDLTTMIAGIERARIVLPRVREAAQTLVSQLTPASRAALEPDLATLEAQLSRVQSSLDAIGSLQAPAVMQTLRTAGRAVTQSMQRLTSAAGGLAGSEAPDSADIVSLNEQLQSLQLAVQSILGLEDEFANMNEAAATIESGAMRLLDAYSANPALDAMPEASASMLPLYLLGAALILLAIMMAAYMRVRNLGTSANVQAEQNERNQQAILRLLDELSNLADGDLTVEATVTEDITGAIADSINFAIEALRDLVITVSQSALLVDSAAKQSEATAHHLVRASETQAKQSVAASTSIAQMAASVKEVAGNAERSSDVARHAVDVAHKGGDAVRRTIEGMNAIRETIQDTSKRIKRLGESSQEIGNIVELIEEIAEQTNILALNASIEASRAGESSRGFAVVADEVQKLAERSSNATRKIEVLVSTIQSDTNEAIVSMERSTTDVVGGALLAENAGAALDEIEQVSHQIASLVHNISESAREQTTATVGISRNMDVLREVSTKAKQLTTATSSAISKLSALASQLRESVSGFHLPEQTTRTSMLSQLEVAGTRLPESTGATGRHKAAGGGQKPGAGPASAPKEQAPDAGLDQPTPRQALTEEMIFGDDSEDDSSEQVSGERITSG